VKQVDANGDGEISFEEFAQMMKRLSAWDYWHEHIHIYTNL
jgi:hypothetical protein